MAVTSPFDKAIAAIREGADCSLAGLTLTVNGIDLAITDGQFEVAWDVMDEVQGDDYELSLP